MEGNEENMHGSYHNPEEAEAMRLILEAVFAVNRTYRETLASKFVGVISPYKEHMKRLNAALQFAARKVEAATVDAYQRE